MEEVRTIEFNCGICYTIEFNGMNVTTLNKERVIGILVTYGYGYLHNYIYNTPP